MKVFNRFIVSNAMLFANLFALWGSSVFADFLTDNWSRYDPHIIELGWQYGKLFDWAYILIIGALIFWYEKPIRRVFKMMHANIQVEPGLALKSRQRLLNEPYFITAIDFISWVMIGLIFIASRININNDPFLILLSGFDTLLTALITVTIAFFMLHFILQKWLAPIFFPDGQLSAVPRTQRTQIKRMLMSLSLAINCIPLSVLIFTHLNFAYKHHSSLDQEPLLHSLTPHVINISLIFICLGIFLALIVSRNLSRPLIEITKILRGVSKGKLNDKVRVTTNDEIGYTGEVINKMTEGLKERERLQQSINIAKEVQQLLLPQSDPVVAGLDIAGKSIYCEETGGDYYDYLPLGSESEESSKTVVIVGDVSGHGIGSALFMSSARAILRSRCNHTESLSKIVNDVNRELSNDFGDSGQFMTLFYLDIDREKKSVHWIRAGHDPAIFYDPASNEFEELKGIGAALGVTEEYNYQSYVKQGLVKGQVIAIGTDGLWETRNAENEMFGKNRLCNIIQREAGTTADNILESVYAEIRRFAVGQRPTDDMTLVIVKFN